MIDVMDFKPEHAINMRLQKAQQIVMTPEYASSLATGPAVSGILDGEVLVCIGKQKVWDDRFIIWGLLSENACKHMVAITRIARRLLLLQKGTGRHEVIVRSNFRQAHRWAELAGFRWHHHEEKFLPGGKDADIYVRHC